MLIVYGRQNRTAEKQLRERCCGASKGVTSHFMGMTVLGADNLVHEASILQIGSTPIVPPIYGNVA